MTPINLADFDAQNHPTANPYAANRMLFDWLSNDDQRAALYKEIHTRSAGNPKQSVIAFQSEDRTDSAQAVHTTAYLLTSRADIEAALTDFDNFSNQPYAALGSGTFMLGLDVGHPHAQQREFAKKAFGLPAGILDVLIKKAFEIASVLPLKQEDFDLAELAEQTALRFVGLLYGFPPGDHPMLENVMSKAFRALNYQIIGKHFVSEPITPKAAEAAMAAMLTRVTELIDQYRSTDRPEELKDFLKDMSVLPGYEPVLQAMARLPGTLSGYERAVVALGSIAGIIGNVQSAVCIAINEFFRRDLDGRATAAAREDAQNKDASGSQLHPWVMEALRLNPPAAFLPRSTKHAVTLPSGYLLPKDAIVILAMGSATRQIDGTWQDDFVRGLAEDGLIFGVSSKGKGNIHDCLGKEIGRRLITHIVSQVLMLPGLSRVNDIQTGELCKLKKVWGFKCESFPLSIDRDMLLMQHPLNVIMNVKAPVSEHAEKLKLIIKYGAPKIEQKLVAARHVHFAWFVLLENDTKLALFTTFDRNFEAYVEHFAMQVGPLFDKLFDHLEDAPPLPVAKFPAEFVQTIRRHNVTPVSGYFFSAYPGSDVTTIQGPALAGHRHAPSRTVESAPACSPIHVEDAQIQRLIVLGSKAQCSRSFVLTLKDSGSDTSAQATASAARRWLAAVADRVTIALPEEMEKQRARPDVNVSIGFTYRGLEKLGVPSTVLAVFSDKATAFVEGAYHRAAKRLADTGPSSFERWDDSFHPDHAHVFLTLHAETPQALDEQTAQLKKIDGAEALCGWETPLDAAHLTSTPDSREVHFGIKDGVSTISIKGIHQRAPGPLEAPANEPGEFLLGHVNDSGYNPWLLARAQPGIAAFFKNASFGILRKMEQDIEGFNTFVNQAVKAFPGVPNAREYVIAKMIGRWSNGAVVSPDSPYTAPVLKPGEPIDNSFDFSRDQEGTGCPFGSHIRRMNPRSDPVVPLRKRPVIRRGMPYGPRHDVAPNAPQGRGLMGLFFCASIEDQFEHLIAEWGNRNPMGTANKGNARDPLVGNHTPADGSVFEIPMPGGEAVRVTGFKPFVTTKGTLYAFFPSVSTIRTIAAETY